MEYTQEQLDDIAQNIANTLVQRVPGLSPEMFEVFVRNRGNPYCSVVIVFENTRARWSEIDPRDIIDVNYDMFWFWEDVDISVRDNDSDPTSIIAELAGINTRKDREKLAELQAENANLLGEIAKLRAENTELRLRPGGPDYEIAKEHYENLVAKE